jgi:hypothetical protein
VRLQTILTELTRYEAEESVTAMYIEDISYGRKTGRLGKEQFKLECIADRIETKRIKVCLGYQYKNWRPHKEDKHFMTPKPDVVALKPDIDAVTDKLVAYFVARAREAAPKKVDFQIAHTGVPHLVKPIEEGLRKELGAQVITRPNCTTTRMRL